MNLKKEHLRQKGWSEEEIKNTAKILRKVKKRKHPHHNTLNEAAYIGVVFLAILCIVAVAFWIIPLFIFAKPLVIVPTVAIIGIGFGTLFKTVIKELDHLEKHHHIIISAIIPIVGIITFLTVITQTNYLVMLGGFSQNALAIGAIFTIFFLTPYYHSLIDQGQQPWTFQSGQ